MIPTVVPHRRIAIRIRLFVLAAALSGCARYTAKPIDPAQTELAFRQRSLSNPQMQAYLAANAGSETAPVLRKADLTTLVLIALFYNPDIKAARDRVDLASAAEITAGTIPNPTIGVGPTHETGLGGGLLNAITGPTFDIPIETAGKRAYRETQARHLSAARAFDLLTTRWQVRSGVRASVVSYLVAERTVALRRGEEGFRSVLQSMLEKSLTVGQASLPVVFGARASALDARLAAKAAESAMIDARSALAGALGLPVSVLNELAIAWPEFDKPPDYSAVSAHVTLKTDLLNRADVQAGLADYAAAESALQVEIAKQYPDIHLGPGYQYQERANFYTLGFTVPIPLFDRNQGPIAEATARREQMATKFLALQERAVQEAERALAHYRSARAAFMDADAALSLSLQQEYAAKRLLDSGQSDSLSLLAAHLERVLAERGRLDALVRAQSALGLLEDAVQRPLGDEASLPPIPFAASPKV